MSEFGGLRKNEKTRHALVGLGGAAPAAAVVLPAKRRPEFPEGECKKGGEKGGPNFPKGSVKKGKKAA